VARHVVDALPEGAVLLVGNSGIVRDLDTWGGRRLEAIDVQHQRGAAGIDGLIAGAFGARLATKDEHPVVVLLGDVAAVHDLGALVATRQASATLVVVVVHNDGGRIFERLPIAGRPELAAGLESLFVVPHGVSIAAVAESLGLAAGRVSNAAALSSALQAALQRPGASVIEAAVPPSDAGPRRRALSLAVDRALSEALR
jgi:2-succinyl-5-enolpyruvyl-6-hydroxy-3-cyclohexene-1-carboxylate synthase